MEKQKIIFWGTADTGKPRVRLLKAALSVAEEFEFVDIRRDVWTGVEDKSTIGNKVILFRMLSLICAYPILIWRYWRAPKHRVIVVGYPGALDVIVLWLFSKLRGADILWDMFISAHDTLVGDRRLLSRCNTIAILVYVVEWLACRAAKEVVLDTAAHAAYISRYYGVKTGKVSHVLVGGEEDVFAPAPARKRQKNEPLNVLFYGQCIPLHGMEVIIRAAQMADDDDLIHWKIIGNGQESARLKALLAEKPVVGLVWIDWVKYEDLQQHIHEADVCLGIFGGSAKAGNVIPNKIFQYLACGKPVITRTSAAIDELEGGKVMTIPPYDPQALLDAIKAFKDKGLHDEQEPYLPQQSIAQKWRAKVMQL